MKGSADPCLMVSRRTGGVEDKYRIEKMISKTACQRILFASSDTSFLYTYISILDSGTFSMGRPVYWITETEERKNGETV